ncbi:polyprenol monophosphomannose synthase [Candidatus Pacearchaeota archaeon]|nr:polyprenol monophosphomannose synthase [Candidatus Pacearchaeota archaeon]
MGKRAELSMILPTYNEVDNLDAIVRDIFTEFKKRRIAGEVIIVDDSSPDCTGVIADRICRKNDKVKVIHRKGKRGLSSAAMEGFNLSKAKFVGLMDSDRSHPTKKIGEMYSRVMEGADLVIGSRYIQGGKIEGWGLRRKVLSSTATLLARPLTRVLDPMTGFFILKKSLLSKSQINSKGFKILLEIIIKSKPARIVEVPITFVDRKKGKSKVSLKEIRFYLSNLLRYYSRKFYDK